MRSPVAVEGAGGAVSAEVKIAKGHFVMLRDQVKDLVENTLLPTPSVAHIRNHDEPIENYLGRRQDYLDGKTKGMPGVSLGVAVRIETLPTPLVDDAKNSGANKKRRESLASVTHDLANDNLLPTPIASEGLKASTAQSSVERLKTGQVFLTNIVHDIALENDLPVPPRLSDVSIQEAPRKAPESLLPTSWGKYEPAIRRWEEVLGREAPAPTNPDGKNGSHRLASEFVEWMMGLPEGWVTDPELGLKRNDQLKALGNGVVPQQAKYALQLLIDDEVLERLGKK